MTRTPSEHYAEADRLLTELAATEAEAFKYAFVQAKVARAQIHAMLAQSPWWPGLLDSDYEPPTGDQLDILRARINGAPPPHDCEPWQHLEHPEGGCYCGACGARPPRPYLDWDTGQPKPCPIETRSATGDRL